MRDKGIGEKGFVPKKTGSARKKTGFTLIELLVAVGIATIVALALGATFTGGIKIYESIKIRDDIRGDILICLEKMEKDIRGMLALSEITFSGEPKQLTFAGIVDSAPGSVTYSLDEKKENLIRIEKKYPQALAQNDTGEIKRKRLIPAKDVAFKYFIYEAELESYEWVNSWAPEEEAEPDKDGEEKIEIDGEEETADEEEAAGEEAVEEEDKDRIPLGVSIELVYENAGSELTRTRTIFIPMAVSQHWARLVSAKEKEKQKGEESETVSP